ncbi:MAG: HD domain-containing protein, partial [Flavobacteriales bacterium]
AGPNATKKWLSEISAAEDLQERMANLVSEISFKGAQIDTPVSTIEAACVQDADRLDAIGAVGIARAFSFGGAHSRLLHHPDFKPTQHSSFEAYAKDDGPTIAHFYEKLLLLKDRMQTKTGKKMAEQRHQFMETYLEQFFDEWEGTR